MPYETVNEGLSLTIPTSGTTNWGANLKNLAWKKISQHRHEGSGDGLQIRTAGLADGAVTNDKLAATVKAAQDTQTPTGTTQTLNLATYTAWILNLGSATGTVTLTLNNPTTAVRYRIKVEQGGTARVVTWPATVKWAGGSSGEPTQYMAANDVAMIYLDFDGTNYYCLWDTEFA